MITGTEIYWITRLDDLRRFMFAVGGISIFFCVAGAIVSGICYTINRAESKRYESNKRWLPISKKCFVWFVIGTAITLSILLSACFVPTTKQMCAIKVLPAIINNEDVQELPNKVVDLANEWLEELKPNKEN